MSFWEKQPVAAAATTATKAKQILPADELLERITGELDMAKIKLDYRFVKGITEELDLILDFINANYVGSGERRLTYSRSLLSYFLHEAITVIFHMKGSPDRIIGIICGRRSVLEITGLGPTNSLDVNFLCLVPRLRSMHLAPYMISVLTKASVERFGVAVANYTIGSVIKAPNFGRKQMFHRPIQIKTLAASGFFSVDVEKYTKTYNTFTQGRAAQHIHKWIDRELSIEMRELATAYYKTAYDIYEPLPVERILVSPAFHTFIFRDPDGKLTDFVSFYRLDSVAADVEGLREGAAPPVGKGYRNGYLYAIALSDTRNSYVMTIMETVANQVLGLGILDLLTLSDILPVKDYGGLKYMRGTGALNYYAFNMAMPPIENRRNGLVTI
jgi:hypothetical protein